ncbi:acyl-CoA dehydrogenase family protein [Thalassospiraceae bacterium LMO-JJ14]|nr:acyl-CoA dehydrogenase family protein [Thalassospiraceae bacterium LMO-JJ14]
MIDPVDALNSDEIQELHQIAVQEFRPRGRAYDENADMPMENLQTLFERGWLMAVVPEELGGRGMNLTTDDPSTFLQAVRVVARGCSGTAHCFQLQNHALWQVVEFGTPDQIDRYVRPGKDKMMLVSAVGSEAKRRHMYMMNTTARKVDGGFIVHGEKNYATNGPTMSYAIIYAALEGVDDYLKNHQMFLIEPDMEGVSVDLDWYRPAGMRCASSPIITLDNVFIEDRNVLGAPGDYPKSRLQGKFHLGFAANYLGTAEGMYQWYLEYVGGRGKGKDGIIQMRTGEMAISLMAAESLFHDAIRAWKTKSVAEAELISIAAKSMAAQVAFEISHKIIHASGSTAMFDEYPLNRYIRDLETHVLHAGHDRSAQIIGQAEFGESFDSTLQR